MRFRSRAGRAVADKEHFMAFAKSAQHGLSETDFGLDSGHDELLSARRLDRGVDIRIGPGVGGRTIDWSDMREGLADFAEDRVRRGLAASVDRGQNGRNLERGGHPR